MEKIDEMRKRVLAWRQQTKGFNQYIGIRVVDIGEGTGEVEAELTPEMLNPLGRAHGGMIYTLCDVAAGTAAASRGRVAVTLTGSINYLRAGYGGTTLRGRATEIKSGRQTAVYDVRVEDEAGRQIACATFTMYYTGQTIEDMQCLGD